MLIRLLLRPLLSSHQKINYKKNPAFAGFFYASEKMEQAITEIYYPLKSPELSAQYLILFFTLFFQKRPCRKVIPIFVKKLCAQICRSFLGSSALSNAGIYSKPNFLVTSVTHWLPYNTFFMLYAYRYLYLFFSKPSNFSAL